MQEATQSLEFPTAMRVVFPRDGQYEATLNAVKSYTSHPVFVANINRFIFHLITLTLTRPVPAKSF